TLAASFATRGHGLLTDDGLVIDESGGRHWIVPSHPSIRLWEDSFQSLLPEGGVTSPPVQYTPKVRILAGGVIRFFSKPCNLRRLYVLGEKRVRRPSIEAIAPAQALMELVKHSFLL